MMKDILYTAVVVINYVSLFYVLTISTIYLIQLISATMGLREYSRSLKYSDYSRYTFSDNMVPISVLVPAYNESATIVDNTRNLLSLDFGNYEVIVVNDGSKDNTLDLLKDAFRLIQIDQPYKRSIPTQQIRALYRSAEYPNLVVVDKENGGKADALNAGINVSMYPVFVSIDADSILERSSLAKIIYSFMIDPKCVAVGGIIRIASGCEIVNGELREINLSNNPLLMLQTNEYLRAFLTGRIGFHKMGMLLIISGAFGAFNKQLVIDAGGYTPRCIGEDMELVVKLHQHMLKGKRVYSIKFLPDPVCWTQPPDTLGDLKKQRKRWHIGLIDTLMRHRDMAFNPDYGRVGIFCLPYFWIFELIGPVFEVMGYFSVPISFLLGIVDLHFMLSFFLVAVLYGTILSVGALLMEENTFRKYPRISQILKLFLYAVLDNFGYRQLNTIYKVEAMLGFRRNKSSWGSIQRRAFTAEEKKK
ncbi:MAG: glycosyltransferase family 2 protein [Clostridia bacterium]|nr:glycosyltransferase family 2 protein [Clostridia bacterium]